ncbi:MAG: hypothetical protein ABIA78_00370 [archaeon]
MKNKSHDEQVERWAKFCKDNPDKFKKHLKSFLDAQIIMSRRFYERLEKEENGREIIMKLKAMK